MNRLLLPLLLALTFSLSAEMPSIVDCPGAIEVINRKKVLMAIRRPAKPVEIVIN